MPTLVSESATVSRELMTAEDFLEWLEPGTHADLIDGEIFMHSPVSFSHARLVNFLDYLLRAWLDQERFGGELHREVVAVKVSQREVFLPDLGWFDDAQVARLAENHAPFAPRWVAEVLSPSSARRDTGAKFTSYEEHGVEEYWILDPLSFAHRFYALEGQYFVEFARDAPWIESRILKGFRVKREWLDPQTLPQIRDALKQMQS